MYLFLVCLFVYHQTPIWVHPRGSLLIPPWLIFQFFIKMILYEITWTFDCILFWNSFILVHNLTLKFSDGFSRLFQLLTRFLALSWVPVTLRFFLGVSYLTPVTFYGTSSIVIKFSLLVKLDHLFIIVHTPVIFFSVCTWDWCKVFISHTEWECG